MTDTISSTMTFMGYHPKTGDPACGILTDEFDVEDAPLTVYACEDNIEIQSRNRSVSFTVPVELTHSINEGIAFYVGNLSGSGLSIPASRITSH